MCIWYYAENTLSVLYLSWQSMHFHFQACRIVQRWQHHVPLFKARDKLKIEWENAVTWSSDLWWIYADYAMEDCSCTELRVGCMRCWLIRAIKDLPICLFARKPMGRISGSTHHLKKIIVWWWVYDCEELGWVEQTVVQDKTIRKFSQKGFDQQS